MSNTYTLYSNSNITSDTVGAPPVFSLIVGGSGSTALMNLYNATLIKSLGEGVVITGTESGEE